MSNMCSDGVGLWDEEDQFFYDVLHLPEDIRVRLRMRSMVGLIPLFAVETWNRRCSSGCRAFAAAGMVPQESARSGRLWCRIGRRRAAANAGCCRCCAAIGMKRLLRAHAG